MHSLRPVCVGMEWGGDFSAVFFGEFAGGDAFEVEGVDDAGLEMRSECGENGALALECPFSFEGFGNNGYVPVVAATEVGCVDFCVGNDGLDEFLNHKNGEKEEVDEVTCSAATRYASGFRNGMVQIFSSTSPPACTAPMMMNMTLLVP